MSTDTKQSETKNKGTKRKPEDADANATAAAADTAAGNGGGGGGGGGGRAAPFRFWAPKSLSDPEMEAEIAKLDTDSKKSRDEFSITTLKRLGGVLMEVGVVMPAVIVGLIDGYGGVMSDRERRILAELNRDNPYMPVTLDDLGELCDGNRLGRSPQALFARFNLHTAMNGGIEYNLDIRVDDPFCPPFYLSFSISLRKLRRAFAHGLPHADLRTFDAVGFPGPFSASPPFKPKVCFDAMDVARFYHGPVWCVVRIPQGLLAVDSATPEFSDTDIVSEDIPSDSASASSSASASASVSASASASASAPIDKDGDTDTDMKEAAQPKEEGEREDDDDEDPYDFFCKSCKKVSEGMICDDCDSCTYCGRQVAEDDRQDVGYVFDTCPYCPDP